MITEATKEILSIVETEEERKKAIQQSVKQLEEQKRLRQSQIATDQLKLIGIYNEDTNYTYGRRVWRIVKSVGRLIDLERHLSEQRKRFAKVDSAISETLHWTSLSEHSSKKDRRIALKLADEALSTTLKIA